MRNQYDAGTIAGTVLIIKLILFFQFTTKGFSIYVTTIILEVTKMENKIDHIIARVLAGEASAEDILFISNWMNEKEENHKTFSLLKSYWSADIASNQYVNPSVSLEKLQDKINRHQTPGKQYLIPILLSVAASIVLIITISSFFSINRTNGKSKEYYTYLTNNNKSEFTLRDGTKVTLNKNSILTYSDAFGKNNRSVKLEGEAFFEVTKNPDSPFEVSLEVENKNRGTIKVLGTVFNAKIDKGSDKIITTLIEGCVSFEGSGQKIKLYPNQQAAFDYTTGNIDVHEVDIEKEISWKDGLIKYKMIMFTDLAKELEKRYNVQIIIGNKKLTKPSMTVSGGFSEEQTLDEILKVISRSLPMKWENKNNTYYIR